MRLEKRNIWPRKGKQGGWLDDWWHTASQMCWNVFACGKSEQGMGWSHGKGISVACMVASMLEVYRRHEHFHAMSRR